MLPSFELPRALQGGYLFSLQFLNVSFVCLFFCEFSNRSVKHRILMKKPEGFLNHSQEIQ